jgi:Flp pilus assembly protein TadD
MVRMSWRKFSAAVAGLLILGGCAGQNQAMAPDALDRPEVARSLMDAAAAAAAQKDYATAAGYYRNVYARNPNNVEAAVGLMQNLREMGAADQARAAADTAIAAKPDDPRIVAEVGKVRLATGQLQDAVKQLERAAKLDPQDWKSRSALGVAYDRLGDPQHAEAAYQAALKISPDNPAVLNNFALSKAMAHDLPGARALLEKALTNAGSDVRMRQNLAMIYALSGDMAQAEALTLRDLPPDLARETLAYYRELAGQNRTGQP